MFALDLYMCASGTFFILLSEMVLLVTLEAVQ